MEVNRNTENHLYLMKFIEMSCLVMLSMVK